MVHKSATNDIREMMRSFWKQYGDHSAAWKDADK